MKALIGFLFLLMGTFLGLVAWDDLINELNWLPEKIQELNIFDMIVHPLFLGIAGLCFAYLRSEKKKKEIAAGKATTTAICQQLEITRVRILDQGTKFLLHWKNTGFYSTTAMKEACGSDEGTTSLTRDVDRAIADSQTIVPELSSFLSLAALNGLLTAHCSNRASFPGTATPMILVAAAEDPAQVKFLRIFEIFPAMLLLFIDEWNWDILGTPRKVQAYRAMALKIITRQIFNCAGEVPAWDKFQPGPIFAVRDLPYLRPSKGIDWTDPKWHFDPRNLPSKEVLQNKKQDLINHLSSVAMSPDEDYSGPFSPVSRDPNFTGWLLQFERDFNASKKHTPSMWF